MEEADGMVLKINEATETVEIAGTAETAEIMEITDVAEIKEVMAGETTGSSQDPARTTRI